MVMVVPDAPISDALIGVVPTVLPVISGDGSDQGSNNIPVFNVIYAKNMMVVDDALISVAPTVCPWSMGMPTTKEATTYLLVHAENMMIV